MLHFTCMKATSLMCPTTSLMFVCQMNSQLECLVSSISSLSALYQQTGAGTEEQRSQEQESSSDKTPVFLSQLCLDNYHRTEDKFTQELTAFTKKQFFEVDTFVNGLHQEIVF